MHFLLLLFFFQFYFMLVCFSEDQWSECVLLFFTWFAHYVSVCIVLTDFNKKFFCIKYIYTHSLTCFACLGCHRPLAVVVVVVVLLFLGRFILSYHVRIIHSGFQLLSICLSCIQTFFTFSFFSFQPLSLTI